MTDHNVGEVALDDVVPYRLMVYAEENGLLAQPCFDCKEPHDVPPGWHAKMIYSYPSGSRGVTYICDDCTDKRSGSCAYLLRALRDYFPCITPWRFAVAGFFTAEHELDLQQARQDVRDRDQFIRHVKRSVEECGRCTQSPFLPLYEFDRFLGEGE